MNTPLLFLILLCGHLSAATISPLDKKAPPLPQTTAPDREQGEVKFDWAPVEINGKEYVPLSKMRQFYSLDHEQVHNKDITMSNTKIKAQFTLDSQLVALNGIRIYLSEPIKTQEKKAYISKLDINSLIDPVFRPKHLLNAPPVQTVILDAGHGGSDKGSAGLESKLTLATIKQVAKLLKMKGYKVILTRNNDTTIPLEERVRIANTSPEAILISLHFNSGNKDAHGLETYVMSAREPHCANQASVALAVALHAQCMLRLNDKAFGNNFQISDRAIKHAKFRLLKDSKHPAVLIEAGFLTNKKEAAKITTEAYQKSLASAIARSVDVYNLSVKKQGH
jgi:N-acetylmuramoyl-L-alanine amidase